MRTIEKDIPHAVHLIGISGSGMSSLAECLLQLGRSVSGSDLRLTEASELLAASGVRIHRGHSRTQVIGVGLIVVSDAIPASNVELDEARIRGIPVLRRAVCLDLICRELCAVMIAGSHGKTTTSAMIAWILKYSGADPSFALGATVPILGHQRAHIGSGEYFVAEACEAFCNLHNFHPSLAVITNIDNEHLNHYGSQKMLDKSFITFANRAVICVIVNGDDRGVQRIMGDIAQPVISYGFAKTNVISASGYKVSSKGSSIDIFINGAFAGPVELLIPGRHVAMNALASIASAHALGLDFPTIATSLAQFTGVSRRWERHFFPDDFVLIDDFAHHPSQIAVIAETALALRLPHQRLVIAFQPQLYSRTKSLLVDFGRELARFDQVLLLDIDGAGERNPGDVSSADLAEEIIKFSGNVELFPDVADLAWHASEIFLATDFVITAGAGSIRELVKELSSQHKSNSCLPFSNSISKFLSHGVIKPVDEVRKEGPRTSEATLLSLLQEKIEQQHDHCAVSEGTRKLTYAQLEVVSYRIMCALHARGVESGDIVGVHMRPCMEAILLAVAIARLGAVYLPIDTATPIDRVRFMLEKVGASLLVTAYSDMKGIPVLSVYDVRNLITADVTSSAQVPLHSTVASDLAYICFTSGTTGDPKGIPIHHSALVNLVLSIRERFCINSATRMLLNTTLSFDVSLGEIWMTLCGGGELCATGSDRPLVGERLGRFIHHNAISHLAVTPSVLGTIPPGIFPCLTCIITAGEVCSQKLVDTWATDRLFFNAYGPTEATVYATVAKCCAMVPVTIGTPLPNITAYILDGALSPVVDGDVGELCLGGIGLARGYINLPNETRVRFIEFRGERLYRTGDLVRRLDNGEIEYLGRFDNQVKILGNRIELEEIENVIMRFSAVVDAVVAIEERTGIKELVCFAVLNEPEKFDWPAFRDQLSGWLPTFMIPVQFFPVDEILLTPNGKKNRAGLLSRYRNRVFQRSDFTVPRTSIEARVASIWKKCLQFDMDVGVYEDFASVGGDSLKALELLMEIESQFGIIFPPGHFGSITTIWRMAVKIEELLWNSPQLIEFGSEGFRSSRIYKGLRDLTSGWKGDRVNEDSIIVSTGGVIATDYNVFLCLQTAEELHSIAWCLGDRFRVHGMRSGHLLTDYNEQDTEDLCNLYIEEMHAIRPSGKLILGGICQGGKIAVRMAELLHERGKEIELLVMLDQMHLQPIMGKVAFFYSEDSNNNPYRRFSDGLSRYDEIYGDRYTVDIVPGVHGTIHLPPQVHMLADKLKQHLRIPRHTELDIFEIEDPVASNNARLVEASGLFDAIYYASQFPQGHRFMFGPAYHYVRYGWHQGYDPCPFFSSFGYLQRAPDVMDANVNPLIHFLQFGIREGRVAWTEQDVTCWHRGWSDRPDLALKVIESCCGNWPKLKPGSIVSVHAHSSGHMVFHAFQDLIIQSFRTIGIECLKKDEAFVEVNRGSKKGWSDLKIIIAPHEFFYLGGAPTPEEINWKTVVLLNSEQLPSVWFRKALPFLLKAPFVLDMNVQAAASLVQLGANARFIPIGYVPGNKIFGRSPETPIYDRDIDLLWIGTNSARREHFIAHNQRLFADRKSFIRLINVGQTLSANDPQSVSGEDFAVLAQHSKILLNVHHFDTPYFEWQRLVHFGFMQACCVVTETATRTPGLVPGEHYFEEDVKNLPELVAWLLDDPEGRKSAERVRVAGHRAAMELFQLDRTLIELFGINKNKSNLFAF